MVLAAMPAMVLVLAAPAYAQTEFEVEQEVSQFGVVDHSVSSQVFNVAAQQFNAGDQTAVAVADADATASAGAFGAIDIDTVNVSLNGWWW